jgi:hypothetical protein
MSRCFHDLAFCHRLLVLLPALAAACGARTPLDVEPTFEQAGKEEAGNHPPIEMPSAKKEAGSHPPSPPCGAAPGQQPNESCGPLRLHLATQAACEIARTGCLDAEGFVSVQVCKGCTGNNRCGKEPVDVHRVFAMGRFGTGHVIGWCDTTSLVSLLGSFDAIGYLGRGATPRVASIGQYPCGPEGASLLSGARYLGAALPESYADGSALATDWDVLIACGARSDFGPRFETTVLSFVRDRGKGFLAVADYVCPGAAPPPAFAQMNAVTTGAGFVLLAENLGDGPGEVDVSCVADYPR